MLIASSNYWNVINSTTPGESLQDEEDVQIIRVLGKNMAWIMKLIENGEGKVKGPVRKEKIFTNFIR